ncbi:MAG: hypothetical protein SGBAC_003326 [Bacillariaceae sp.]
MTSQQREPHIETNERVEGRSRDELLSKAVSIGESENGSPRPLNTRLFSPTKSSRGRISIEKSFLSSHRRSGSSQKRRDLVENTKQSRTPKRSSRSSSRRGSANRSSREHLSSTDGASSAALHIQKGADRLSSSERISKVTSNRNQRSSPNRKAKSKPRRHKSLVSDVLFANEENASFVDGGLKSSLFKQGSKKKGATISTLYRKAECAKAKAKASRESSQRAVKPGMERVSDNGTPIKNLYGSDMNAEAKARAGSQQVLYGSHAKAKASKEGYPRIGTSSIAVSTSGKSVGIKSSTAVRMLYGSDAEAKAKASRGASNVVSNPDVDTLLHSNTITSINTLYGSDAKAKAKLSTSGAASNPGVETAQTANSVSIGATNHSSDVLKMLYGHDSDAKAKAAGGLMFAANPAVQSIGLHATLVDNEAETNVEKPVSRRLLRESTNYKSGSASEPKRKSSPSFARDNIRIPNDPELAPNHDNKNMKGNDEGPKKARKKWIGCFVLSLLLIGGGTAAYFFFQNDNDNEGNQISTSSNIQDPTRAPTSMSSIAPSDGGNMTISPTPPDLLFQPPSESNCEAIAKNETIAGRDEMEEAYFGLELEVVLTENLTMTEPLVNELLDAIQEKILPSLAGCTILVDEFVEAWRFVIFDAFVTGNVLPDETCLDEALAAQNCHLMSIQLDLFLKGFVRFLDIIGLIQAEEKNISNHLGLSDPFSVVKLLTIANFNPTSSPSVVPSDVPSSTPSELPTAKDDVYPTPLPTATPTRTLFGVPTRIPSLMPFSAVPTTSLPVITPSFLPIDVPTVNPSTLLSETPSGTSSDTPTGMPSGTPSGTSSAAPTGTPSDTPSLRPSEAPSATPSVTLSALPTPTPTATSSIVPTALPSKPPTNVPSVSPISPAPSMHPSATPSSTPSLAPSSLPSNVPSSRPTITPSYWATCGLPGIGCGGEGASPQNLNHNRVGGSSSGREIAGRCCSDTYIRGFSQFDTSCPYAQSEIDGVCYNAVTYREAEYLCQSVGARLCTLFEVAYGCTRRSGCGHKDRFVWTSTPDVPPSSTSFWTVCGQVDDCPIPAMVQDATYDRLGGVPMGTDIATRCCSNVAQIGFKQHKASCPFAASDIGGVCYKNASHDVASSLCAGVGARLCTKAELENDCAAGPGCSHNARMIWSSDSYP